jgi:hypothetical protein
MSSAVESVEIIWEKPVPTAERLAVEAILRHPGLLSSTWARLLPQHTAGAIPRRLLLHYLATGGAKQVYLVTAQVDDGAPCQFVLKTFLPVQLAHLPPGATVGGASIPGEALDAQLLERMVWAAGCIDERAPGFCPRFGGFWQWQEANGRRYRVMTEAYVQGESLERWKSILEDRFVQGDLDFTQYTTQRRAMERQAIAAYLRLWVALERQTFTSDPSPWNVLFTPTPAGLQPSLIDLHSIHDGGTPLYVFQILEAQFGPRDEVREHVLCPGIVDAIGAPDARRFLLTVSRELKRQDALRRRHGLTSNAASCQSIQRFLTSLRPGVADASLREQPVVYPRRVSLGGPGGDEAVSC